MSDESLIRFLVVSVTYILRLHDRIVSRRSDNRFYADQAYHDSSIPWEEESFSRWMGWRGQEAQEEEVRRNRKRED